MDFEKKLNEAQKTHETEAKSSDILPLQKWTRVDYAFIHVSTKQVPTRFGRPLMLWNVQHIHVHEAGMELIDDAIFVYPIPTGARQLAAFVGGLCAGDRVAVRYLGKKSIGGGAERHEFVWCRL